MARWTVDTPDRDRVLILHLPTSEEHGAVALHHDYRLAPSPTEDPSRVEALIVGPDDEVVGVLSLAVGDEVTVMSA